MSDTPNTIDTADLAPEPHPRQKRRNVVGLVAIFLGGLPNVILLLAWAGVSLGSSEFLGNIIGWSTLLALPVGLVAAILSWTKVFRFRDWWFGLVGMVLAIGFLVVMASILSGIEYGFPGG